ncbi:MAG: insulinase family protein [Tenuifilaceae bacterium]|jgi:predicted Zn-dependent peptidase|nr:insulinase family protein [Bacteroidales bacterium]MDI9517143.1 insulinase family protein [Bacteroidota bacterium]NLH55723.1 insulinase family protein [Rikenellaceae bacterium]OQC65127.1 MAG: Protease 3 precursor [Bacteroidetes bacterium ADurb.Bin008]HNV80616.1 insulinase family protein [Tenuifilaceae bacterium]
MKTRHFFVSLLAGVILILGVSQPVSAFEVTSGTLKITQYTLPNGLTVILNPDNSLPEAFGVVIVKTGGKNDPPDATGLAHYMEHMLFKGTQQLGTTDWEKEKPHIDRIFQLYEELGNSTLEADRKRIQTEINEESLKAAEFAIPNEMSNLINSIGGTNLNAGTGPDWTIFYNKFPSSQIFKWIDLYAHRFIDPVFRSFQAELEVVYEEKNMYADQFQGKLLEEFQSHLFKNHPYGQQPLIGTIEHLKNPSLKRMLEFYKNYYVANNMALVISGDFNIEEIAPVIEEKFGALPSGQIPETHIMVEEPFAGREFHQAKLTPIKIGLLGFRTVTSDHPDYVPLEMALKVLNNRYQTGLLDKLSLDGKVLGAQMLTLPYHDHGAAIALFIPKIVGQKLEAAEKLIMDELAKLRNGEFDEWVVDAVKNETYVSFTRDLENIYNRATLFAEAFAKGETIEEALAYPEKVMGVTKEDIIRVANKYFGNDYLAFYSKTGFPKKEKIDKPGFKPLVANTNAKSVYANHFEKIDTRETTFTPIDFNKDVEYRAIDRGIDLYYVKNPMNDIFTLTIKYGVGSHHIKLLDKAAEMMSLSGTENRNVDELKNEFAKIGCSYSIWSSESFTQVRIEGLEENIKPALILINELITTPKLEQSKLKTMIDGEKANRKFERSEPDNVASALIETVLYGKESHYLDRPTMDQLKKLKAEELTSIFKQATQHTAVVHYVGKTHPDSIKNIILNTVTFATEPKTVQTPVERLAKKFDENTIFFVNKKKARQSKIFFFANGEDYNISIDPYLEAFNEYFGGGFSGLVLQEIREYRSLAYGAAGTFQRPVLPLKPFNFFGYVATQADKSLTAIETYDSLIRTMPQKPERIDLVKNYLFLSAQTKRPSFRNLSSSVESWRRLGYTNDPMLVKQPAYQSLTWDNIWDFYTKHLMNKPIAIAIVGDKSKIDLNELKRMAKVIEIKENTLYSK